MRRPKAILFDLDCTLTDRPRSIDQFAHEFAVRFADHLEPSSVDVAQAITAADQNGHRPRPAFFQKLRRNLPWTRTPPPPALEQFWQDRFPLCTHPTPGLHQTLQSLRQSGTQLALVTNGRAAVQTRKIKALDLEPYFQAIVISESAGLRKPDPRIFQLATAKLGVTAIESWFVGDNPHLDILAAQSAGLTAVWLTSSCAWPVGYCKPSLEITALPDLLHLIAKLPDFSLPSRQHR
jgi:putative hydrolase of the HAD superfamily